ncbi:NADH-quinone oxidoreductase subunit L [Bowdeniella nasicola]|uniref:NADH-quinone oxidoreductase subunit L n=1 Tax=Bowdeniella nasicola TaxID=208480 RepID=A0A1H3XD07_9ACTO|nr:NADH-quinone oxidoreductase subunit L [Bowdeniella nasicola]SDZ96841.1 NADH-quinone oxidoreductase subunit L [Bowdeniella nasicola]
MTGLLTASQFPLAIEIGTTPATGAASLAWLLIAIPLASAAILLLAGRMSDRWGHWLGVAASWASFVLGAAILFQLFGLAPEARSIELPLYDWMPGLIDGGAIGLLLDPLSLTFVMLVTFVGSLIHVYAVAYMEHDPDRRRFFAYLNLFIAAMLTLVLADSYLLLFVGWEGVGLASYLLIGFWNQVPEYATAAKKAFVMNRIGDAGLLLAMATMFATLGSVKYADAFAAVPGTSTTWLTVTGILLLVGACGKSAQFPLQAWLGDAMAGPTPVSALIHAATMVTAGVYLVVRSGAIYAGAPTAQLLVAIIGAITLLFGAIVGCAKDDMKKVLAASTMSQIGYMMLAAGLGPIGAAFAIFHLLTHGFFKAQMFLGAGSVMHGMDDQVDMRRFGGLSKYMKVTWITFAIGWLAILGVPPFAGFFSKDKIIEAAFVGDGLRPWIFGLIALLGAGITAFYMSRLFFMVFHGDKRWSKTREGKDMHPHESPALMTVPMIVLSVFSIGLGLALTYVWDFTAWLAPVTGEVEHHEPVIAVPVIMGATLAVVILGVALAYVLFARREVATTPPETNALVRAARADLHQDAINEAVFMAPSQMLTRGVQEADHLAVDGLVMGAARGTGALGRWFGKLHNGYVRSYAAITVVGVIVALVVVLASRI